VRPRAALAGGVGLLVSGKLPAHRRRAIGAVLVAVGVVTRVQATAVPVPPGDVVEQLPTRYSLVQDAAALDGWIARARDQGYLGINKPAKYGGMGLDYSYQLVFLETLGHIRCGGVPMAIGVQTDMSTPALAKFGSDEVRQEFLVPAIAGDAVTSIGVSEPGAGSDVASIRTNARSDGDDYVINGGKLWITNGTQADWICLLANTSDGPVHRNKSLICVPMKSKGVNVARKLDKLGRRSTGAGFGRDRTTTYLRGGADPGNVVSVPLTYNQHKGAGGHTAAMPEGLAEFFVRACSPAGGVVLDPFAGSGTTPVVARRLGRRAGGLEIHRDFADAARERLRAGEPDDTPVTIQSAR